jgi:hypothetical protein
MCVAPIQGKDRHLDFTSPNAPAMRFPRPTFGGSRPRLRGIAGHRSNRHEESGCSGGRRKARKPIAAAVFRRLLSLSPR